MRRAARRDSNESTIIAALKQAGAMVWPMSAPGMPDLLCAFRGDFYALEVKDPAKPPSGRRLTKRQIDFFAQTIGYRVARVETVEQALQAIGAIR